jgi:hypothetical protein
VTGVRLKLALAVGAVLGVAAICITLLGGPIAVARVNVTEETFVGEARRTTHVCQSREVLPRETSAIRLRSYAFLGPRVTVEVLAQGRAIAHGQRGSGWTGGVVTVPVNRLPTSRSGVELCFTIFGNPYESVELAGEPTTGALAARTQAGPLSGRVRVEYLRPSPKSWWSLAPEVARRMGLGHAASGTWCVFLVLALMAGLIALCSRLMLRELG